MPLTKEVVSFPFAAGLDEKSSDKTTPPGKLVTADNVRIEKTGQMIKREAFVRQSRTAKKSSDLSSLDPSTGKSIIPHKESLLHLSKEVAYRRAGSGIATTPNDLLAFQPYVPCHLSHENVKADRRYKTGNAHHVRSNGFDCYVYVRYELAPAVTQYETMVEIYDAETRELVYQESIDDFTITNTYASSVVTTLYLHPQPQICAIGNYVFVFINDSGTLKYTSFATNSGLATALNPGSLAAIGPSLIAATPLFSVDVAKNYYVTNTLSRSEGAVCVAVATSANTIKVQYLTNSTGTLTNSTVTTFTVTDPAGNGRNLFFAGVGSATDENPVISGLGVSCLNDINSGDTDSVISVVYTGSDASANPFPQVTFFAANFSATETEYVGGASGKSGSILVNGGAASVSDGGRVHVYAEVATEATVIDGSASSAADRYSDHEVVVTEHTRGGATTHSTVAINCSLTSHPFRRGSYVFAVLTHYSCNKFLQGQGATSNMFLVDSTHMNMHAAGSVGMAPVAFAMEHQARVSPVHRRVVYGIQRVQSVATDKFMFGCSKFVGFAEYIHNSNGFQAETSFGTATCTIDFNLDRPVQHVEAGKVTLMTGGSLMTYDGRRIVESGFITAPRIVESRLVGTGSISADYKYMAVWEWVDAEGNIHRSAPSNIEAVSASSKASIEIEVLELPITNKIEAHFTSSPVYDVECVLYRTVDEGSIFYRYAKKPATRQNKTIQFEDTDNFYSLANGILLEDNEQIYTTSELSNGFIGSCTDIAKHKSRIFARTTENIVNCSKPLFEGDAPAFVTDQLAYNIILDGESNPITCIESNLEHLLIFTDENGYILAGDGPDAFGAGGFLKPRKFAPGIGVLASSPHTVTRDGAFLVTTRGLYLVKTNLSIEYIGAAVEDLVDGSAGVISIDVMDGINEIRVALKNTATDGGTNNILRYNYAFQQWTCDTVPFLLDDSQVDTCVLANEFYRLTSDGYLHKQTPGGTTYQDNCTGSTVSYDMKLKTGFIPRAGLQKSQRMYRWMLLGDYLSNFTLTVKTFTDYSGSTDTTFTKAVTSGFDNPMQLRGHIDKQKSQAIAVEITANGTGACAKLDSLALEVGRRPAKTSIKLPATETL